MRIPHKYIRNKHFRVKHWKRIRSQSHPFETMYPHSYGIYNIWSVEEQVKHHFKSIEEQARNIEKGSRRVQYKSAPKWFRKMLNQSRKAQERQVLQQIKNGDLEKEFPKFKPDAAWDYW